MKYLVNDTETGNAVICQTDDIKEAYNAIMDSYKDDESCGEERLSLDLYEDGERIYCGRVHTDAELRALCGYVGVKFHCPYCGKEYTKVVEKEKHDLVQSGMLVHKVFGVCEDTVKLRENYISGLCDDCQDSMFG